MFRKKVIMSLIALLMLSAYSLVGCGSNSVNNNAQKGGNVGLTAVGGSVGGSWSVYTEGVVEAMRKGNPTYNLNAEPGSTTGNLGVVSQNQAQLGLAFGLTAYQAYKGMEPFKNPMSNLRAVCALIPINAFQFTVSAKSGLTSFEQIKNNKFPLKLSVDSKGSPGDIVTQEVLKAYGVTYQDIENNGGKVYYLSSGKTYEMMADGRVDAAPDVIPVPSGDIIEAMTTIKLGMLPLNDSAIDAVNKSLGMTKTVIPQSTYNFLTADLPTGNMPVILVTNADQPDDVIYNLVKSIHENIPYLKTVAKGFNTLDDKTMIEVNSVPFHPGAEKYFKEIGLLK